MQYRRSTEFIFKDKRLRNAIPPQLDSSDGSGARRFVSANPKLSKILERNAKKKKQELGDTLTPGVKKDQDNVDEMVAKGESYLAMAFQ